MEITPKMNEVIVLVAKHLAQQKEQAMGRNGCCMYRTPGGRMCAVGCLIPEELYHESLDAGLSTSVSSILTSDHPPAAPVGDHLMNLCGLDASESVIFYRAMQRYHDLSSFAKVPEHVKERTPRMFISDVKAYTGPEEDLWKYLADNIREVVGVQ